MKRNPVPPNKVIKILERIGFQMIRQKGSHVFIRHLNGRITLVPVHSGENIGRGLITKIISFRAS